MTENELREIKNFLRERVMIENDENTDKLPVINFTTPTEDEMINAGLNSDGVRRILNVEWWNEMVTDIVETPEICDPEDSPQQILEFAKDVVTEYIGKRFTLNEE